MTWSTENLQSICSIHIQDKIECYSQLAQRAKVRSSRMGTMPRSVSSPGKKCSLSVIDLLASHLNQKVSVLLSCQWDHRATATGVLLQGWPKETLIYLLSLFLSSQEYCRRTDQERSSTGNFGIPILIKEALIL